MKCIFFTGGYLQTKDGIIARGANKGGVVYIRADDPNFTASEIAGHEIGHELVSRGSLDMDAVISEVRNEYTKEELSKIVDDYGLDFLASGVNEDELADITLEEITCDALGGMNAFASNREGNAEFIQKLQGLAEKHYTGKTGKGTDTQKLSAVDINSQNDYYLDTDNIGGDLNDSRRTAEVSGTSGKVRIDNEGPDGNNYLQSRPEKKWANLDKREKERISRSVNMNMVISLQVYSSKLQVKEAMKMIKFNWMETYERAEDRTLAMLEDMAAKARMSQESSQDTNGTTTMSRSENLHDSSSRPNSQSRSIQR